MIVLFQMRSLSQLNSHAYKVYINSGETHFYSNILAIFNQTDMVQVDYIGKGPFLSDFMVKQSFRSYSVQITALLVK